MYTRGENEGRHPSREGLRRSDEGLECLAPLADKARHWVRCWHGGDSGGGGFSPGWVIGISPYIPGAPECGQRKQGPLVPVGLARGEAIILENLGLGQGAFGLYSEFIFRSEFDFVKGSV